MSMLDIKGVVSAIDKKGCINSSVAPSPPLLSPILIIKGSSSFSKIDVTGLLTALPKLFKASKGATVVTLNLFCPGKNA